MPSFMNQMSIRARRRLSAVAVVALTAQLVGFAPAAASELEQPPKLVGIASNSFASHSTTYSAEVGIPPAFLQLFWSMDSSSSGWLGQLEIAEDFGAQPYIEITTADLDGLVSGSRDSDVATVVTTVKDWLDQSPGRRVLLAPLPEANLKKVHLTRTTPDGVVAYKLDVQGFLYEGKTVSDVKLQSVHQKCKKN